MQQAVRAGLRLHLALFLVVGPDELHGDPILLLRRCARVPILEGLEGLRDLRELGVQLLVLAVLALEGFLLLAVGRLVSDHDLACGRGLPVSAAALGAPAVRLACRRLDALPQEQGAQCAPLLGRVAFPRRARFRQVARVQVVPLGVLPLRSNLREDLWQQSRLCQVRHVLLLLGLLQLLLERLEREGAERQDVQAPSPQVVETA
mmetsp:Transcript_78305/g.189029  ORF Transcript_78305/g.189029 Transcript_78305/m.189029 type:complete len:205 (+) Transcript_78305:201-815(+)